MQYIIDINDVTEYFIIDNSFNTVWNSLSEQEQIVFIKRAEENFYQLRYKGTGLSNQKIFPRTFKDTSGNSVDSYNEEFLNRYEMIDKPDVYIKAIAEQVKFLWYEMNYGMESFIQEKFSSNSISNFDLQYSIIDNRKYSRSALKWVDKILWTFIFK